MTSARMLIEQDCTIILERALLRKTLVAFGEDGCGQYGRKDTPSYFDVVDIRVDIETDDDYAPAILAGAVSICLRDYDAKDVGHIKSDRNFDISLSDTLKAAGVSTTALSWARIEDQVDGCVTFFLDVGDLLGYS